MTGVCSVCLSHVLPLQALPSRSSSLPALDPCVGLGGRDAADPEPRVWSWCWSSIGDARPLSTQRSTRAPKGACWKSQVCEGTCSPWSVLGEGLGQGLAKAGLDYGKPKEALWGSETWICLYCCCHSPLTSRLDMNPWASDGLSS